MKYEVFSCAGEIPVQTAFNMRSDAKLENVYKRCASEIIKKMVSLDLLEGKIKYSIDMPNIWRNGAFPSIWITDDHGVHDVGVVRDGITFV